MELLTDLENCDMDYLDDHEDDLALEAVDWGDPTSPWSSSLVSDWVSGPSVFRWWRRRRLRSSYTSWQGLSVNFFKRKVQLRHCLLYGSHLFIFSIEPLLFHPGISSQTWNCFCQLLEFYFHFMLLDQGW